MLNFIKQHIKGLLLITVYVFVAVSVYIAWFDALWNSPLIDSITGVLIIAGGYTGGIFYMLMINKEDAKKEEAKAEEPVAQEVNE